MQDSSFHIGCQKVNISFGSSRQGRGCSESFPSLDVEGLVGLCQIAEAASAEGSENGEQESHTWGWCGDLGSARDTQY